jgi:hypothetical protein
MAGKIYNGIIINGAKYEAVEVLNDDDSACEHCGLSELCDSLNFSPCEMFEGVVRFRIRR